MTYKVNDRVWYTRNHLRDGTPQKTEAVITRIYTKPQMGKYFKRMTDGKCSEDNPWATFKTLTSGKTQAFPLDRVTGKAPDESDNEVPDHCKPTKPFPRGRDSSSSSSSSGSKKRSSRDFDELNDGIEVSVTSKVPVVQKKAKKA